MPLPNDEHVVALANDLLQMFDQLFGLHPGYRAAIYLLSGRRRRAAKLEEGTP